MNFAINHWNRTGMEEVSNKVRLAFKLSPRIYKSLLNVDNDNIDSRKVDDMSTTSHIWFRMCVALVFRLFRIYTPIQEATSVWIDISIVPVPCTCTTDFIKFDPCMEKTVSNETTNGYTVFDTHKTKDHKNKNKNKKTIDR